MFDFSAPALPVDQPIPVVAQTQTTQEVPVGPTNTFVFCRDAESALPDSAANSFSPVPRIFSKSLGLAGETVTDLSKFKVAMLEPPHHGEAKLVSAPSHHWSFAPNRGYTGIDRITYIVEVQGKRFKMIINFWVVELVDDERSTPECESHKFPLVSSNSTHGSSA